MQLRSRVLWQYFSDNQAYVSCVDSSQCLVLRAEYKDDTRDLICREHRGLPLLLFQRPMSDISLFASCACLWVVSLIIQAGAPISCRMRASRWAICRRERAQAAWVRCFFVSAFNGLSGRERTSENRRQGKSTRNRLPVTHAAANRCHGVGKRALTCGDVVVCAVVPPQRA